jgi:hypothetical protein
MDRPTQQTARFASPSHTKSSHERFCKPRREASSIWTPLPAAALFDRDGYCEVEVNHRPLYWDAAHLSGYGSRLVAGNIVRSGAMVF